MLADIDGFLGNLPGLRPISHPLDLPMGLGRDFFGRRDAVTILSDSVGAGWHGAYAAVTRELPHETERGPVPSVWLTIGLETTSLRRIIRGQEHYSPSALANLVTITPPGEAVRDVIGIPASAFHVFLTDAVIQEVAEEILQGSAGTVSVAPAFCLDDPVITPLMHVIRRTLRHPSSDARLKIDNLVRALAARILLCERREEPQPVVDLTIRQMRLLRDYLDSNLHREISIEDFASLLGLSRTQFLRRFKAASGTSPHRWVMQARVEKAKQLLSNSDFGMAAVSKLCGFASQSHLSTVFQSFVKMSPSAFRRDF